MKHKNTLEGKITKIEPQKNSKNRYSIYINDTYAFGVSADILVKYRLIKGKEVNAASFTEIIQAEEQNKADNYAIKLLSYRPRSQQEIIWKMKEKGYDSKTIAKTLDMLKQRNYINDEYFAETFTRSRIHGKKLGKNRIKQELYNKGIPNKIVQKTIEQYADPATEYEMALEIAAKKINSSYKNDDRNAQYRKLGGFLQRRGFDYEIIMKVLNTLLK